MNRSKRLLSLLLSLMIMLSAVSFFVVPASAAPVEVQYAGERKLDFNHDWRFRLLSGSSSTDTTLDSTTSAATGARLIDFDDSVSNWSDVDLPHDWSIYLNYGGTSVRAAQGSLQGGTGWYRKSFTLPNSLQGKKVSVRFDGVMQVAEVFVNGVTNTAEWKQYLGYNTFDIDITDHLKFNGEKNVIAVKCQASNNGARWYQGAGIYRNVSLITTDPVYVPANGVYVTTPKSGVTPASAARTPIINPTSATAVIVTDVANDNAVPQTVTVKSTVYNKAGNVADETTANVVVPANGKNTITQTATVPNPKLWSVDAPNLYWVKTEILSGATVMDTFTSRFGFRYIELDSKTGMYINGILTELNGVCEHSDLGPLGMETYQAAVDRRIRKLKTMGTNAIRTGHNPVSPEFIEACDRLGMMLMEEPFDQWCRQKNSGDYFNYFNKSTTNGTTNVFTVSTSSANITWVNPTLTSNAERDIKAMVDRDKNAPSVVIWSTGNEIDDHKYSYAPVLQTQLMEWIREVETNAETQRPAVAVPPWWDNASGQFTNYFRPMSVSDIGGFNYATSYYARGLREYPTLPLVGAETVSAFATRGKYFPETYGSNSKNSHGNFSNEYPFETNFELANTSFIGLRDNPAMLGEFVWTGHDYLGEPTPHNNSATTGVVSSSFGIIDTCGFEKDSFYMYKSMWTDEPTCHLLPQNWTKWTAGQQIPIIVYTNGRIVDLYLNGKLIGTKNYNRATSNPVYVEFGKISFEPGELKAVSKDVNGNVIATDVIYTASEATKVDLVADRSMVGNDGYDLIYVEATIRDSAGIMAPDAENRIFVQVTGGEVIAQGNGDHTDRESQRNISLGRRALSGKALFIIKATKGYTGPITITSTSAGLISNTVTVNAVAASTLGDGTSVLDYEKPDRTVGVGIMPILPETIRVMLDNGLMQEIKVKNWDLSAVDISKAGSYIARGTSDAISGSLEANIYVKTIEAVKDINVTSIVGIAPPLPMFVTINYTDGAVGSAPVTWADVAPSKYAGPGTFDVVGTVGPTISITAHVTVKAFTSVEPITVYTTVNKMPDMPAGVNVKFNDGSEAVLAVEWNLSEDNYAYPGSSEITGKVLGSAFEAKATINVQTVVYLSDLEWAAKTGTVVKDKTIGNNSLGARGDFGGPPVNYLKGLGTQSPAEIEYNIAGMGFNVFQSYVGLSMDDGGMTGRGAVKFEVYLDGVKKFESAVMDRQSKAVLIDLDVTGVSKIKIATIAAGTDGIQYDLGDWCDSKFFADNIHVSDASLAKQVYINNIGGIPTLPTVARATVPGAGEIDFKINWPTLTASMFSTAGVQRIYGTLEGASGSNVLVKVITNYNVARTAADFHDKVGAWSEVEKFDFPSIAVNAKPYYTTLTLTPRLIYSASAQMLVENVQAYGFQYGTYPNSSGSSNTMVFATPNLSYFQIQNIASTTAISNNSNFTFATSPDNATWTTFTGFTKGAIASGTGTDAIWARRTYTSNDSALPAGTNFLRVTYPSGNSWQFNMTEVAFRGGENVVSADMERFKLGGIDGLIDQNAGTIDVDLPYGTNVTNLTPELMISAGADYSPKGAQNFTAPLVYTVTNGAKTKQYTVNVNVDAGISADLLSFSFGGRTGKIDGKNVTVYVPSDTYMTSLTPVVKLSSGASMPQTVFTFSFDAPTKLTVVSANGLVSNEYTVTVIEQNGLLTTPVASPLVLATTTELGTAGLPTQIEFNLDIGGTAMADVVWGTGTFTAYTTIEAVIGTATFGGSVVNFTAQVEVVKPGTIYWVSSGSASTGSLYYDAVKAFLGTKLYNTVPDKNYATGSWGVRQGTGNTTAARNITPTVYGGPSYGASKWAAFYGGANNTAGNNYEYVISDLPAGTYTIDIGNTESWSTGTRTMTNSVYPLATPRANPLWTSPTISYGSNARVISTGTFTLTETTSIIVRFTAVNAQAPCVGWFALSNPEAQSADKVLGLASPLPNLAVYVSDANPAGIESKLPAAAMAATAGMGNVPGTIAWDLSSVPAQLNAYDTAKVSGVFTADELEQSFAVSTYIEVVPRNLKYFIDAGSMVTSSVAGRKQAGSRAWDSVKTLVGSGLLNANSADQPLANGWGYTTTVAPASDNTATMHPAIDEDAQWYKVPDYTDKYNSGWFSKGKLTSGADDAVIEYQLTLSAGDYMLTSGTKEYWPPANKAAGNNRPYKIEVLDSEGTVLASKNSAIVTANNAQWGTEQVDTLFFTLPADGVVRYQMTTLRDKSGSGTNSTDGDAGHQVSWLAVAQAGFYATPITTSAIGTVVTTNVLLENYTASQKTGYGILSGYDGSSALAAVSIGAEVSVDSNKLLAATFVLSDKLTSERVRLFFWDKNYVPLCEARTVYN